MNISQIKQVIWENKSLYFKYLEEWNNTSVMHINQNIALKTLKNAYYLLGEKDVEVRFFDSPYAAFEAVASKLLIQLIEEMRELPKNGLNRLNKILENQLTKPLEEELIEQLTKPLGGDFIVSLSRRKGSSKIELLKQQLRSQLKRQLGLLESPLRKQLRTQIDNKLLKHRRNTQLLHQLHNQQKFSTEQQLIQLFENQILLEIEKMLLQKLDKLIMPEIYTLPQN